MASLMEEVIDFMRARQLNIAVAAILTISYLVYQYWGVITKAQEGEQVCRHARRQSRSRSRSSARSRSRSGHNYKVADAKHRRGRKPHRRCADCIYYE